MGGKGKALQGSEVSSINPGEGLLLFFARLYLWEKATSSVTNRTQPW